jgi:uncharacterized membrane protein
MAMPLENCPVEQATTEVGVATPLRCTKERILQTLCFEAGGLLLVAPVYASFSGKSAAGSLGLLLVLSVLMMMWSPLHNTAFDWCEARHSRRVASDRPHALRFVHAASHEVTSIAVTLPALMVLGGHSFWGAVVVDIGLTAAYAAYAYVFHIVFDWLRPVIKGT